MKINHSHSLSFVSEGSPSPWAGFDKLFAPEALAVAVTQGSSLKSAVRAAPGLTPSRTSGLQAPEAERPRYVAGTPLRVQHGHFVAMHSKMIDVPTKDPFFAEISTALGAAEASSGLRLRFALGRDEHDNEAILVVTKKTSKGSYKGFRRGVVLPLAAPPGAEPEMFAALQSYLDERRFDETGEPLVVRHWATKARYMTVTPHAYQAEFLLEQQARGDDADDLKYVFDVHSENKNARISVVPLLAGKDLFQCFQALDKPTERLEIGLVALYDLLGQAATAHEAGVINRDIKLENSLLGADGLVKLCDFGLGYNKFADDASVRAMERTGTARYLAPEMAKTLAFPGSEEVEKEFAEALEHPEGLDIYALGILGLTFILGSYPIAPYVETSDPQYFTAHWGEQAEFATAWQSCLASGRGFVDATEEEGFLADQLGYLDHVYQPVDHEPAPLLGTLLGTHFLAPRAADRGSATFLRGEVRSILNKLYRHEYGLEMVRPKMQRLAEKHMSEDHLTVQAELRTVAKTLQEKFAKMPSEERRAKVAELYRAQEIRELSGADSE